MTGSVYAGAIKNNPSVDYSAQGGIKLEVAGTYAPVNPSDVFDTGAAEIGAYDMASRRVFVTNAQVNTVDVLDIQNIHNLRLEFTIDLSSYEAGVNSVAAKNGIAAVAVEADPKQDSRFCGLFQCQWDASKDRHSRRSARHADLYP